MPAPGSDTSSRSPALLDSGKEAFKELLQRLGAEHDREVGDLRSEIGRLRTANVPSCLSSSRDSDINTKMSSSRLTVSWQLESAALPKREAKAGLAEEHHLHLTSLADSQDDAVRDASDNILADAASIARSSYQKPIGGETLDPAIGDNDSNPASNADSDPEPRRASNADSDPEPRRASNADSDPEPRRVVSIESFHSSDDEDGDGLNLWRSSVLSHPQRMRASDTECSTKSYLNEPYTPALALWDVLLRAAKKKENETRAVRVHKVWKDVSKSASHEFNAPLWGALAQSVKFQRKSWNLGTQTSSTMSWHEASRTAKRKFLNAIVINPNNVLRMAWDIVGMLILTHDLLTIPMELNNVGIPTSYFPILRILDLCWLVFWTMDMLVNFVTGFYNKEGYLELRLHMIMVHYMKTWFPIDVTILTIDWATLLFVGIGQMSSFMRIGKTFSKAVRVIRLLRLLRFIKMNRAMTELLEKINSEITLAILGIVKLLLVIVLTTHYIACFWFGLSQFPDPGERSWSQDVLELDGEIDRAYAYATSLHWSITQFTPASMEVVPTNTYERFFNVVVIIAALVMFSSFVSSITNAMTHIRDINAAALRRDASLRKYFAEKNISYQLASRVWHYVRRNRHVSQKRPLKVRDVPVLQQLPAKITEDLQYETWLSTLLWHPFFSEFNVLHREGMRKLCTKGVKEVTVETGEELSLGMPVKYMGFVIWGCLEYHLPDDDDLLEHVYEGEWMCEAVLWAENAELEGSFVGAAGGCDLLALSVDAFHAVGAECAASDVYGSVMKYAELFVESWCSMDSLDMSGNYSSSANLLFNDPDVIYALTRDAFSSFKRRTKRMDGLKHSNGGVDHWNSSSSNRSSRRSEMSVGPVRSSQSMGGMFAVTSARSNGHKAPSYRKQSSRMNVNSIPETSIRYT